MPIPTSVPVKIKLDYAKTVPMMEPKAEKAMKKLAKRTGGQFYIVRKGGTVTVVPVG